MMIFGVCSEPEFEHYSTKCKHMHVHFHFNLGLENFICVPI